MPTDRLTMRSTNFDNNEKEKMAAKLMLSTPAIVVVMRMDDSREGILSLNVFGIATVLQLCHIHAIIAIDTGERLIFAIFALNPDCPLGAPVVLLVC
jgi:hypothetical protein